MISLNVPVPEAIRQLASSLAPKLAQFESVRDRHTLLVKRFETDNHSPLDAEVRQTLRGLAPFEVTVSSLDVFTEPVTGPAPVVYLTVESPRLLGLHATLADRFGAIDGLEGDNYVPHITLARGGDAEMAERLLDTEIEPVTWTVTTLIFWHPRYEEQISRIQLPI